MNHAAPKKEIPQSQKLTPLVLVTRFELGAMRSGSAIHGSAFKSGEASLPHIFKDLFLVNAII